MFDEWRRGGAPEDELPTAQELKDDLALLVMSTVAFNMGIGSRRDREPEVIARLDLAIRRVCSVFNIAFADDGDDPLDDRLDRL